MALIGTFTKDVWVSDPIETEDIVITYREDLPIEHGNYDKRGTTETITRQKQIKESTVFTDAYIHIVNTKIIKQREGYSVIYCYLIYNSKQDRLDGVGPIAPEQYATYNATGAETENYISLSYEAIKNELNFESVIDD